MEVSAITKKSDINQNLRMYTIVDLFVFLKKRFMEIKIDIKLNQLAEIIRRLPENEKIMLTALLESKQNFEDKNEDLPELLKNAPTWSEEDYNHFLEARNHMNRSRIA